MFTPRLRGSNPHVGETADAIRQEPAVSENRLDLNDTAIQLGKQMGVKFVIDTDAHTPSGFPLIRYGLDEARRGWLAKGDVLNTLGLNALLTWLRRNDKH